MAVPFLRGGDYPAGLTPEEGLKYFFSHLHQAYGKSDFSGLPLVVAAHFYASGADICGEDHSERLVVGGQDCIEAGVVGRNVAYTALGHIHKHQQVGGAPNAFYSGSALPMSFSEIAYRHGVQLVDIDNKGHASIGFLPYAPLRSLCRIPESGGAASAEDIIDAIGRLPKRGKNDSGENWPYLEIRVEERQPEPTLMHDVTEALKDRAVHFCRMVRVSSSKGGPAEAEESTAPRESLEELTPLQMARRVFQTRFQTDMPQELVERFKLAEKKNED